MTAPHPATSTLLTAARDWYDAGYAVIPSHEDGGKRPFGQWKQYQTTRPTWEELEGWLNTGNYTGIGVITGAVSGGAQMVEIEGPIDPAITRLNAVMDHAKTFGSTDLVLQAARGCVEQSAGGGLHMFMRTPGVTLGNTKLAMQGQGAKRHVVSETRGEGGFVIVAPTPARNGHQPDAAYLFLQGSTPAGTPTITVEQRDELHLLITLALNEDDNNEREALQRQAATHTPQHPQTTPHATDTTFGNYRAQTTWADILTPAGWTFSHHASDGRDHWTRPGKNVHEGTSATTLEDGPMYVFSSSTAFPQETGISKEYAYTILNHGGDMTAASRQLREQGYAPETDIYDTLKEFIPLPNTTETAETEYVEETPYDRAVRNRYSELRINEDAKTLLTASKLGQAPPLTALNLTDFLNQPDSPTNYRIQDLWPSEGRVLLAAAAKSGKTTMIASNLIPAIVDGTPFLGNKTTQPLTPGKTIAYLNMEVGENTLRKWMRDAGIKNTQAVHIANLRGKASALQLGTEQGRKRLTTWLQHINAELVILDPLAPVLASLGLDENSNSDVAVFFAWWSETLTAAGIKDDLIVHHTGHAGQRSRGASRLLDEPDAIWTLTKDTDDDETSDFAAIEAPTRYLAAYGRDVEMPTETLDYNPETRTLVLTGEGKKAGAGKANKRIISHMSDGKLLTKNQIAQQITGDRNKNLEAVGALIDGGMLIDSGKKTFNNFPLWALAI